MFCDKAIPAREINWFVGNQYDWLLIQEYVFKSGNLMKESHKTVWEFCFKRATLCWPCKLHLRAPMNPFQMLPQKTFCIQCRSSDFRILQSIHLMQINVIDFHSHLLISSILGQNDNIAEYGKKSKATAARRVVASAVAGVGNIRATKVTLISLI